MGLHLFVLRTSLASQDHFREAGNVLHADVVMDPEGKSRGFGTVRYRHDELQSLAASPPSL